jgi:hypothetical protein
LSIFDTLKREKTITPRGEAMYEREIETKVQKLPENLKKEVLDYIDFLLEKYQGKKVRKRKFTFDWEGGLSDIKDEFTSVELQHKALEWR